MHTVGQQIDPLVPLRADVAVSFFANAGSGDDGAGAGAVRSGEVGGVERRELRGQRAQHPDRGRPPDGVSAALSL